MKRLLTITTLLLTASCGGGGCTGCDGPERLYGYEIHATGPLGLKLHAPKLSRQEAQTVAKLMEDQAAIVLTCLGAEDKSPPPFVALVEPGAQELGMCRVQGTTLVVPCTGRYYGSPTAIFLDRLRWVTIYAHEIIHLYVDRVTPGLFEDPDHTREPLYRTCGPAY